MPPSRPLPGPARKPPSPPHPDEDSAEYEHVVTGDFELAQVRPKVVIEEDETIETLATGDFESFEPKKRP